LLSNCDVSARTILVALSLLLAARRLASAAVDPEDPHPTPLEPAEEEPTRAPAVPTGVPPAVEEPARRRTHAVYLILGFGSPVGGSGLEGVQRFGSHFELAAGFGVGDAAASSEPHAGLGHFVQWALMPRLRLGDDATALTVGAGISGGEYGDGFLRDFFQFCNEDQCPTANPPYPTQYVIWSNFETGIEHWWRNGFAIRVFAGYGHGLASGNSFNLPYLGFGLGYAF
jgi:hypothetical protein